jgi:predicted PolB exonuclease-like 3'-5' exonuclease
MALPESFLVLDLETVIDAELYTPPVMPEGEAPPFPPLYAHRPILIGALWLDRELGARRLDFIGEGRDEAGMLAEFGRQLEAEKPQLVSYNGRGFDLPVLALRSLRHGLPLPYLAGGGEARQVSSGAPHLDLCELLGGRGLGLDAAARLIGLPGKQGMDGSQVAELHARGDWATLRRYCLSDVVQTGFLLLRIRLLQGLLGAATYRERARRLLELAAADEQLGTLCDRIERERILLEPGPGAGG